MTNYEQIDFSPLLALSDDEVVTHSRVRDVPLPSGKVLALITLDNGRDHTRPNTLGPATLTELGTTLDALRARADAGDIAAVAVTGKQYILAAGADLSEVSSVGSKDNARMIAQLGHHVLGKLSTLGVPSFAFVNGLALGGGLEIALNSTYRTVDASAAAVALPEVFLGIIPGWGGAYLLPNLIGIENALEVVVSNPLKQNRVLKPAQAFELGIMDAIFPASTYLEDSLRWADGVLSGTVKVERKNEPGKIERLTKWPIAIKVARGMLESKIGTVPRSPYVALELLDKAKSGSKEEGFAREDEALADLVTGDQFAASMYAFDLVQKRAKRPVGAPDKALAKKVTKVGIIGAGLMASQFALLFVRKLQVPVLITDLDQARVDKGVAYIHDEIGTLEAKGRLDGDTANKLRALVTGTTDKAAYADCDFVIEAVFEEVGVKQSVFAEIESVVAEDAILATNTSSLSVEEIGAKLAHPERLVGFHFFNPVAVMPLIEVVKTPHTSDAALSTAFVVAKGLGKNAVLTADAPGFVVNRLLAKVMGEAARAVYEGTPVSEVEKAFAPLGLPMGPFQLIDLVGWKVAAHVQDTMVRAFPDRFYANENFHELAALSEVVEKDKGGRVTGFTKTAEKIVKKAAGSSPTSRDEILRRVQEGLAQEIRIMLDEDVVPEVEDIDLCLILGAGWPFIDGGATPYLDREGASERVFGDTFHHPPIRGIA
ncbi:enoyl-CoA hydratase/isomerase family protein [Microbacterium sp. EYE_5]|uniref:3-hydroxyacyl-CoA dehydrogenase NAD-binding domain-containing protein n=1 Tax=unclassified Microbacterium TaxID=2609290 RepID=UPI002005B76A|nr:MULTISPECIES: 3-hydroxyacyl-CoA dehydrogenase NAD-binding domain-containing protein [unclassified Microbacterium]MCK6080680.1 enoyl-CoA hydratase/isomerase family protein [Microbacterium sp. EYE_382]MCK6085951.1 enoyl-CoA hydratase/isomerase family protein [Microbacterium sp. EYE_384]MCK6124551.1 enoyl-CoA hydratase/isomerase family protein [Microbacterium sp. EYE_80]MCK6127460.1 enoyl-CoA hydratase/isomerase family protein [Microbacterium sp. EYE_79]MCK6141635.1 enoyl-CoA hydratase/isomera